jgi:hypothetical protein
VPERTNDSISSFLRETARVVGNSLPILVPQAVVVLALVYVEQGRAFLLLDNAVVLLYLMAFGVVTTVVFSRVLARRVDPDPDPAPDRPDRLRWLALQCGSVAAGLASGFLPAGLIEKYVSGRNCGAPRHVLDSYRGSAATVTLLVAVGLDFYLIWRIKYRKDEQTTIRDVWLLPTVVFAAWVGNKVSSDYHLLVFGALLIAATVLLTLTVLKGPSPTKARGGILEWRARLLACVSIGAGIFLAIFPDSMPSGVALWIILQFWTAAAVLLTVLLRRLWIRHLAWFFTALALLAIGAITFSGRAFQARDVRIFAQKPSARPALSELTNQWLKSRLNASGVAQPYPIILVTAAGGGIRAAYWTANLLAAFEDRQPAFAEHVFALSGVSGGSVGATVFDALVKAHCKPCRPLAQKILHGDFLAPALTSLLTRDPVSTTFHVDLPDRGIALEKAFERAWKDTMHTPTFEESFDNLWQADADHKVPSLFLNSTEAGSAERAVFSNVSMAGIFGADKAIQDVAEKLPLRLSTAMLLSARFPYISPEGKAGPPGGSLRFVDGGYFDNSGAATLLEVVRALRKAASELGVNERVQIVTLVIRNEPMPTAGCPQEPESGGFSTPLAILDQLRSERAEQFTSQLRTLVMERKGDVFLDSFQPESGVAEFPVGWTLPSATIAEMDAQIERRMKDGSSPIAQLLQSLPF